MKPPTQLTLKKVYILANEPLPFCSLETQHCHSAQARTRNVVCPMTNLLIYFPATQPKFRVHNQT